MNRSLSDPFLSRYAIEWRTSSGLIEPACASSGIGGQPLELYTAFVEKVIQGILPEDILITLAMKKDQKQTFQRMQALGEILPLMTWNLPSNAPCTLSATFLGPSTFASEVGRYLSDTLSLSLVPGHSLNISSVQSLSFRFLGYPKERYFFQQIFLDITHPEELVTAKKHVEGLSNEIRLNILALKHARSILAIKNIASTQKKRGSEELHFLFSDSVEDKISQIQHNPFVFDRDIFNEIRHFTLLLKGPLIAFHDFRHLGRLIAFQYLFRRALKKELLGSSRERHILLKLLRPSPHVLGVLGGLPLLQEGELFEERHLLQAIARSSFHVKAIENSLVIDQRSHDPIRIFYVEIEKKGGGTFSLLETKEFKKNILRELKTAPLNVVHPVFMPRNEEEVMRNIVILSRELKYVTDLPQVIISFATQTEEDLEFTVILLRLLKKDSKSLSKILAASRIFKLQTLDVKILGKLRKKHLKEANIFSVLIRKNQFLRTDYSLDLFQARQAISQELGAFLGNIRDFNGSILAKQQESFQKLQGALAKNLNHPDSLLENFFYALNPPIQQSLLPTCILKILFELLLEAFYSDYSQAPFSLKTAGEPGYFLLLAASKNDEIKELLASSLEELHIPSSDLCSTHVTLYGITAIGYVYQTHDTNAHQLLCQTIEQALSKSLHR